MNKETKKAIQIGGLSILVYLVSYIARNILSVATPVMVSEGLFTKEYVGHLSSVYLCAYAIGQLVNGFVGDMLKPKYMITAGCLASGAGMVLFPVTSSVYLHFVCFAVLGFGLSALRGPLMKIIAENTLPKAAQNICVLFSASSFAGPLVASVLSCVLPWQGVFLVTGAFSVTMGLTAYLVISLFERRGLVTYNCSRDNIIKGIGKIFSADGFWFFMLVAVLSEIVASSINFWIPTYLTEYLSLSSEAAAGAYSFISLLRIGAPFLCVFIYNHLIKNRYSLVGVMYAMATACFALLPATHSYVWLNIGLIVVSKIATGIASAMLWSIYIPGLASTGKVSSANGIFDVTGYLAASAANAVFSSAVDSLGWERLIIIWAGMAAFGMCCSGVSLFVSKRKNIAHKNIDF